MLLSPGMCWFPTPPAILKPKPRGKGRENEKRRQLAIQQQQKTFLISLFFPLINGSGHSVEADFAIQIFEGLIDFG